MSEELSGLDLVGLLDRLQPVPEPPPISLWPQTEAWIWVGLALLAGLAWLLRRVLLRRRANAYRRAALAELAAAGSSPAALAEILRRTALAAYPRVDVAGLYGDDWLAFLDRTGGLARTGAGTDFREGPGKAIAWAPYREDDALATGSAEQLAALTARWVRHHR